MSGRGLFGLTVEEATEAVADDAEDPGVLELVAEDGVVSQAGVESAVAHVAKVVATPETRLEVAADAVADARADAARLEDIDAVASRLAALEAGLSGAEDRLEELQAELESVLERADDPTDAYALARSIGELTAAANDLQGRADELADDAQTFRRWVGDPAHRYREFEEDLEALADATGEVAESEPSDGATWLDATLRQRALSLLLADLRAERCDLEAWADREDCQPPDPALEQRLDAVEDQLATAEHRLEETDTGFGEQFGDRVAAFEAALAELEVPVPWGEVWERYERHTADGSETR